MHEFVSIALVDAKGRVLLRERDELAATQSEMWGLPGGGIEAGEGLSDAAVRELAEEDGVRADVLPEPLELLGRYRFYSEPCGDDDDFALYRAQTELTDSDIVCGEGRRMVFVDPREARELPLIRAAEIALAAVTGSTRYRERFGDAAAGIDWGLPGGTSHRFAGVILVDPMGRILLQERDEHPRIDPLRWGLVGGHLDEKEDFCSAAYRELEEETGVRIGRGGLALWREFAVDHLAPYGTVDRMQVLVAATTLTDADIDCREGRQIVFVDPDLARTLDLTRAAAAIVPEFLGSETYASFCG